MSETIIPSTNLNSNADSTSSDLIIHILQLIPVIIGLLFGKQYIDKKKRQKQKLALSHSTEIEFLQLCETGCYHTREHTSIGYTLCSRDGYIIPAGERQVIPTGVSAWLPPGCYGRLTNIGKLAAFHGVIVADIPYDQSSQGSEITVLLINTSKTSYHIAQGEEICQLILEVALVAPIKYTNYQQLQEKQRYGYKSNLLQRQQPQQQPGGGDLSSAAESTGDTQPTTSNANSTKSN
jgi:dUTPase